MIAANFKFVGSLAVHKTYEHYCKLSDKDFFLLKYERDLI